MAQGPMTPELLALIAARFRALSDPARLRILDCLRDGESSVRDLAGATGLGQASVSKHLQFLFTAGFVDRRKEGLFAYYSLAGADVFTLCDIMCGRLAPTVTTRKA